MSLDISRIRALCFDIDGTLSDSDDALISSIAGMLKPLKFLFPANDPKPAVRRFVMAIESPGNLTLSLLDKFGIDDQVALLGDKLYERGIRRKYRKTPSIPGAISLVERLYERYPISLVSARSARSTQAFIDQFNLQRYLVATAHAQTCRHTKPSPDPVIWAADQMGVDPEACLMIGDTTMDIRAGVSAGAQTVGVLCGFGQRDELKRAGADLILDTTSQLEQYFLL